MKRTYAALFLLLLVPATASAAEPSAADKQAARTLAADAKAAFDSGAFSTSLDLYRRASTLVPAPTLWVREARCLAKLNQLVEAREVYVRVLREPMSESAPKAFKEARHEAEVELAALEEELPRLRLTVAPNHDVAIAVDGTPMAPALLNAEQAVDPGPHVVTGTIDGASVKPHTVTLAPKQHLELALGGLAVEAAPVVTKAAPVAPPPSRGDSRALAWTAFGVGAAGLGVGVVTGLLASSKHSSLEDSCPGGACPPSAEGDLDSFRTLRTVSTVGYVTAGVGLAAGLVLYLTTGRKSASGSASHPGISGTF